VATGDRGCEAYTAIACTRTQPLGQQMKTQHAAFNWIFEAGGGYILGKRGPKRKAHFLRSPGRGRVETLCRDACRGNANLRRRTSCEALVNCLLTTPVLPGNSHPGRSDMEQSLHHRIRERAYQLWNASGRMEGQAEQYWLSAEREVLAKMSAQPYAQGALDNSHRQERKPTKVRPPQKRSLRRADAAKAPRPST
jgi:hypothetical protein